MMNPVASFNSDLADQTRSLKKIVKRNKFIAEILSSSSKLKLPNWYVGAGCITQTIWNALYGFPLTQNIKDIDLVYFDSSDLSSETENNNKDKIRSLFCKIPLEFDVKNQARVHIWYKKYFGYDIKPYSSTESAIDTWPTTATAIGIRNISQKFVVYAPYGLNDLFRGIVRPNKVQITKEIYLNKVARWKRCWPDLKIIPW